jgi:1-acyl-sn-glycerol-3-phosphate acyltransferase
MYTAKWAFFKNILITGKKNIPYGKPVIIASNHPSSFMDPIFVGVTMGPQIHFLARGDVFKTPFVKWVLGQINILPIFRKEDSDNNHEKNELTYQLCADLFKQNKFIVIYPEGYCVQEKKLRPLKKGATRLAFFTMEKYNWDLDLHILPTGVNYSNPNRFQSDLVINYGKAIRISDFKEEYYQDKNKVNTELTRILEDRMKDLLIIIDNRKLEPLADAVEKIYKKKIINQYSINYKNKNQIFKLRKAIGKSINESAKTNTEELEALSLYSSEYFKNLEKNNLRDWLLENSDKKQNYTKELIWFILCSPLFGIAFLLNRFAFKYPYKIARKKVKLIEFFPSVLIGSGAIIFALYFILLSLLVSFFLPTMFFAPLITLLLIALAFGTVPYYRNFKKLSGKIHFNHLLNKKSSVLRELFNQRDHVSKNIMELLNKHPLDL